MNGYYDPSQYGPPWWAYIFAVPLVIAGICWFFATMRSGTKVKCWKTVNGYRVRDYDAERRLADRTRP